MTDDRREGETGEREDPPRVDTETVKDLRTGEAESDDVKGGAQGYSHPRGCNDAV